MEDSTERCEGVDVVRPAFQNGSISVSSFQGHGELGYYARKSLIERGMAAKYHLLRPKTKRRLKRESSQLPNASCICGRRFPQLEVGHFCFHSAGRRRAYLRLSFDSTGQGGRRRLERREYRTSRRRPTVCIVFSSSIAVENPRGCHCYESGIALLKPRCQIDVKKRVLCETRLVPEQNSARRRRI